MSPERIQEMTESLNETQCQQEKPEEVLMQLQNIEELGDLFRAFVAFLQGKSQLQISFFIRRFHMFLVEQQIVEERVSQYITRQQRKQKKGSVPCKPRPHCIKCGRNHGGMECWRSAGKCLSCGKLGHKVVQCPYRKMEILPRENDSNGQAFALAQDNVDEASSSIPVSAPTSKHYKPQCLICRHYHGGECWRVTGQCYRCGGEGHKQAQCPRKNTETPRKRIKYSLAQGKENIPKEITYGGHVYTLVRKEDPEIETGTPVINEVRLKVLFDSRITHVFRFVENVKDN